MRLTLDSVLDLSVKMLIQRGCSHSRCNAATCVLAAGYATGDFQGGDLSMAAPQENHWVEALMKAADALNDMEAAQEQPSPTEEDDDEERAVPEKEINETLVHKFSQDVIPVRCMGESTRFLWPSLVALVPSRVRMAPRQGIAHRADLEVRVCGSWPQFGKSGQASGSCTRWRWRRRRTWRASPCSTCRAGCSTPAACSR